MRWPNHAKSVLIVVILIEGKFWELERVRWCDGIQESSAHKATMEMHYESNITKYTSGFWQGNQMSLSSHVSRM